MKDCGLYIHVPFCLQKCNYCDFISYAYQDELAEPYLLALFHEITLLSQKYNHPGLKTVYLGGGTPTCLTGKDLTRLLAVVKENFPVDVRDAEITCELNPATVSEEDLRLMREAGFNRLSMGVQAFDPDLLRYLGRAHDVKDVRDTYNRARKVGFDNISLDLIFAIPGQSKEMWEDTLHQALALEPEHLSLYNLKIEEGTPFHRDYLEGKLVPVDEELDLWMYKKAITTLNRAGLHQYEISNFAQIGCESRHNLRYWRYQAYLAVGPGAHGFDGSIRYENQRDLKEYATLLKQDQLPWEEVLNLTQKDRMEEFIFMGLRLLEGVSLREFEQRFEQPLLTIYKKQVDKLQELGLVRLAGDRLALTKQGIPLGNDVFAEFLL